VYNDIKEESITKFITNTLQKIDETLQFKVKLKRSKNDTDITSNINYLKEEFGELVKIIE